ncbi:MAG: hypothetical protein OWS74_08390, partial [Firmicutes bacterium]|nr:hypothetical protein [Bacillota bacterium]
MLSVSVLGAMAQTSRLSLAHSRLQGAMMAAARYDADQAQVTSDEYEQQVNQVLMAHTFHVVSWRVSSRHIVVTGAWKYSAASLSVIYAQAII